ncbi:uncharacterized protein LOC123004792 isoform X1 [Tribolium madens]|uniref:uncharacterized protein LOC123004792 isoform X1 n=1 Tax=Tribolium madens TaxID=41895 RepID=UPI001CF74D48|nr:uncharacterized protein LOC123004792 isoform X1 [Tribolium madens]
MNRLRFMFIVSTIASVITNVAVIAFEIYEIVLDQKVQQKKQHEEGQSIVVTHLFISLSMQFCCNAIILIHIFYIAYYVLRSTRYNWQLSCHYFTYIVLEIVSVVCVIGKYSYLKYPLALHLLTGVLFVMLFFFNCWAVELFENLEYKIREQKEAKKLIVKQGGKVQKTPCVRIPLHGGNVNTGAGPSKTPPKP